MGDTVPLLRTSPERSTQDPVKEVGVSDILDDVTDTIHELFEEMINALGKYPMYPISICPTS